MINHEELKELCDKAFENMRQKYGQTMTSGDYQTVAVFINEFLINECKYGKSREHISNENVYTSAGYKDREDYLRCMADDFSVGYDVVEALASTLGPNEDFDGLISSLEDMEDDMLGL